MSFHYNKINKERKKFKKIAWKGRTAVDLHLWLQVVWRNRWLPCIIVPCFALFLGHVTKNASLDSEGPLQGLKYHEECYNSCQLSVGIQVVPSWIPPWCQMLEHVWTDTGSLSLSVGYDYCQPTRLAPNQAWLTFAILGTRKNNSVCLLQTWNNRKHSWNHHKGAKGLPSTCECQRSKLNTEPRKAWPGLNWSGAAGQKADGVVTWRRRGYLMPHKRQALFERYHNFFVIWAKLT
jgi:hypothetical protein